MSRKSGNAAQDNYGHEQSQKHVLEIASRGSDSLPGAFLGWVVAGSAGSSVGALGAGADRKAIEIALKVRHPEMSERDY